MNTPEEFYLKNYPYNRNGTTEVREAKGFAKWWDRHFKGSKLDDRNLKQAMDAWRDARSTSV